MTMNSQMPPAGLSVDTCSLLEVLVVVGAVGDGSREGLHHPPLKGSLADPGSQVSTQAPVDSPPKTWRLRVGIFSASSPGRPEMGFEGKRVAGWVSWGGWVGLFLDRFDAHNVGLLPLGRLCLHAVCTDALMLGGFDLKSGA
eukprot:s651_g18.t1